jgi:peptidoglycan/xylan/chitin deacetylase (PgdA/CDA1 family)
VTALPPVLCYHRVGGPRELGVTRVATRTFGRQMRRLAEAGWHTVPLTRFTQLATTNPRSAIRNPQWFLLTFDDGYASLAEHAYPVLADLGFTATTFLVTDFVGRTNTWDLPYAGRRLAHLDWATVERWHARGFDFGSHGATHRRLTWLDGDAARAELERSRAALAERLGGESATAVAYPFAARGPREAGLARAAGYTLGFGGVRGSPRDPYNLPRVPVYLWDALDVPFGLRADVVGMLGAAVAHVANRCAVGTSLIQALVPKP